MGSYYPVAPTSSRPDFKGPSLVQQNLERERQAGKDAAAKKEAEALRARQIDAERQAAIRSSGGNLAVLNPAGQAKSNPAALQAGALGGLPSISVPSVGISGVSGPTMSSTGQTMSSASVQAGSTPGTPAGTANVTAQTYKPLEDLAAEGKQFRDDLRNNTGKIAAQGIQALSDFNEGSKNQSQLNLAQRGMGPDSGVALQQGKALDDSLRRNVAGYTSNLVNQRENTLNSAIGGSGLSTTMAPVTAAQTEKGIGLQAQNQAQNQANQAFNNQIAASNLAFNQYMALLNQTQKSPYYTGF